MADFPPPGLGGEANPNSWHFSRIGEAGPLPNPIGHTFPFLSHDDDGRWRVIGTGFYISDGGIFVTARHVVEDVLRDWTQASPLFILQLRSSTGLFGATEGFLRPIHQCWMSDAADVALGAAARMTDNATGEDLKNWAWTLSWSTPPIGVQASTYAFPNHAVVDDGKRIRFAPDAYTGLIQESGDYRDSVRIPFPYLQVDFRIHGAASGGPILVDGRAVGVNCSEFVSKDHPPGPGFGAQSRCLGAAFLDDVVLPTETVPRRVTFDELVRAGSINVDNYSSKNPPEPINGRLVKLDMRATAKLPAIEMAVYL